MLTQPNIVNLRYVEDIEKWIQEGAGNNVYVARKTRHHSRSNWCNPFRLKDYGFNQEKVLDLFEKYLVQNEELIQHLPNLKGKVLGCWCAPSRCHAEILHRMAGNVPVYESHATDDDSLINNPELLGEKVTHALQALNDVFETNGHVEMSSCTGCGDLYLPLPTVDVATPTVPSLSTTESTNTVYESLLESDTSSSSSSRKTPKSTSMSRESTSTSSSSQLNFDSRLLESKLAEWREKLSKSFTSSSLPSPSSKIKRPTYSAPASPAKRNSTSPEIERPFHSAPPVTIKTRGRHPSFG